MLPVELVQLIALRCVAGPRDHEQIISLSHVCRSWRSAILGLSELFVSANWDRWHHELLEIWCERAGSRPLSIHLHDSKMFEASREDKPVSAIVLLSNLSRCTTLCIKFVVGGSDRFGPLFYDFLHTPMPLLVNLTIHERKPHATSMWPPTVDIYASRMPNLRVLDIYGLSLKSYRPLATVTDVKCSIMTYLDTGWQAMMKSLPNLEILSLSLFRTMFSRTRIFGGKLVLPSLKVLELAYVDSGPQSDDHTALVEWLDLPMLETVVLRDVARWSSGDRGSYIVHYLVRIFMTYFRLRVLISRKVKKVPDRKMFAHRE